MRSAPIRRGHYVGRAVETDIDGPQQSTDGPASVTLPTGRKQPLAMVVKSRIASAFIPAGFFTSGQAIAELAASREADRIAIGAQQPLFASGDSARCYFLVLTGEFIVHHRRDGARPSVRFIGPGDLMLFASSGLRDANCDAITPAVVIPLECGAVETLAASNASVEQHLERLRATERELVLGGSSTIRERHCEPGAEQPDVPSPPPVFIDPNISCSNFACKGAKPL